MIRSSSFDSTAPRRSFAEWDIILLVDNRSQPVRLSRLLLSEFAAFSVFSFLSLSAKFDRKKTGNFSSINC
jgi:hypothetical protein